jgi:hypothetical protein
LDFQVEQTAANGQLPVVIQFAFEDAYGNIFQTTEEFIVEIGSFIPNSDVTESLDGASLFPFGMPTLIPIVIVAIVAIIVSILLLRRRGKSKDVPF